MAQTGTYNDFPQGIRTRGRHDTGSPTVIGAETVVECADMKCPHDIWPFRHHSALFALYQRCS